MAADYERADRIRALKLSRPDLTWRRIADHVGVTERSATDWQKLGGIDYENAKKLAEIFEVDHEYIWRGPTEEERAPSPFAGQDALADRLDAYEQLIAKQNDLLEQQSRILERIEERLKEDRSVRDEIAAVIESRGRDVVQGLPEDVPSRKPKPRRSRA